MRVSSSVSLFSLLTSPAWAFLRPFPVSASVNFHPLASTTTLTDTPDVLPEFANKDAYLEYMESVAALPKGFASGTATGTFISAEAPALGPLPIRATVIHLTEGATENWAAVFTKNKVRMRSVPSLSLLSVCCLWSSTWLTLFFLFAILLVVVVCLLDCIFASNSFLVPL